MNNKTKSILLFISKCITICINMLIMMMIARSLTTVEYSDFKQVSTQVTMVCSVFSIGIPYSVLYFLTSDKKKKEYLINVLGAIAIICLIIFILCTPIFKIFNQTFNTNIFTRNFNMILIFTILSFIAFNIENIFIAYDSYMFLLINAFLPNIIFLITILLAYKNGITFYKVIMIYIIRELIKFILLLIFSLKQKANIKLINFKRIKEIIIFGLPIGLSSIIGTININIDKMVAGRFVGKEEFALLATASYEIPIMSLIGVSLFNIIISPLKCYLNEKKYDESIKLWLRCGQIMTTVVVPMIISLIIFSNQVVTILFSDKYIGASNVFKIYQVNALTRIYIFGTFFLAANKSKLYSINAFISLISNTILSLLLVKPFGIYGVAISTVLSNLILIFIQNYQVAKIINKNIFEVYPYKDFVSGIIISLSVSILMNKIYNLFFDGLVVISILFIILSVTISFLILSICINKEILQYFFNILKKIKGEAI